MKFEWLEMLIRTQSGFANKMGLLGGGGEVIYFAVANLKTLLAVAGS